MTWSCTYYFEVTVHQIFADLCPFESFCKLFAACCLENFKQLLLCNRWAKFAQNLIWSLRRSGEWKISETVSAGWPRWPSCPYMVKNSKNPPVSRMPWGWIFAQIIGDGRSAKVAKMISYLDVWPLYGKVMFGSLCIYMSLIYLYWKIVENFKWLLLWSCWASYAQILYGASLGWEQLKIAKMVAVHWPRWPPCPYMVKKL